jgi:hypothetical protein
MEIIWDFVQSLCKLSFQTQRLIGVSVLEFAMCIGLSLEIEQSTLRFKIRDSLKIWDP